jgi:predicted RNase H-like nuclease
LHVVASFADVLALRPSVIAVDMPIGLSDSGPRACDTAARRLLGPRRASVFPAPLRAMLAASSHAEANAMGRRIDGRGVSHQAFNLIPKIRELDAHVTTRSRRRIVEASPELCFALLLGAPCAEPKRAPAGRAARLAAIAAIHPDVVDRLAEPRPGAAVDDVLDAFALTVTARRVASATAERLGDGSRDARGLRLEINL